MISPLKSEKNWGIRAKNYYLRTRVPPFSWIYRAELQALQKLLLPFKSRFFTQALDLGTGCGDSIPTLLSLSQSVTAIDLSEDMIQYASQVYRAFIPERLSLCKAEASSLPFNNSTFDLIFSIGLAEYFNDLEVLMKEINRVCKPQAAVFITISPKNFGTHLRKLWGAPIYFHTESLLKDLAFACGFKIMGSKKLYSQHLFALQLEEK